MQTEIADIEEQMAQTFHAIPDYKMEDYAYNKRMCEAIRAVLHHFGTSV